MYLVKRLGNFSRARVGAEAEAEAELGPHDTVVDTKHVGLVIHAMDKLRAAAASAQHLAAKGASGLMSAGRAAAAASSDAAKHAAAALSANPAQAAVGQEVAIGGRRLVIESLLAEGGFASVYLATNRPELAPAPGGGGAAGGALEKFVLKKMFAGGPEATAQLTAEVKLMER